MSDLQAVFGKILNWKILKISKDNFFPGFQHITFSWVARCSFKHTIIMDTTILVGNIYCICSIFVQSQRWKHLNNA